jgi:hypothetical protein
MLAYVVHSFGRRAARSANDDPQANVASALKDTSEIAKNFLTAVAILVGGWWTLHLFTALEQEADAKTRIAEAQARIANVEADTAARVRENRVAVRKTNEFPIAISLQARLVRVHRVSVIATVKNLGDVPLYFEFPANAFTLARFSSSSNSLNVPSIERGTPVYIAEAGVESQGIRILLPQQERHVAFLFGPKSAGVYLVQVLADYGDRAGGDLTRANEQTIIDIH